MGGERGIDGLHGKEAIQWKGKSERKCAEGCAKTVPPPVSAAHPLVAQPIRVWDSQPVTLVAQPRVTHVEGAKGAAHTHGGLHDIVISFQPRVGIHTGWVVVGCSCRSGAGPHRARQARTGHGLPRVLPLFFPMLLIDTRARGLAGGLDMASHNPSGMVLLGS